jgi:hemerythrin superfamily protein
MNAIELLISQHRDVEKIFTKIERAKGVAEKRKLFQLLGDNLAIHTAIEEHQFYPAVKAKRTEDILLESLHEHLSIKRVLADLLAADVKDESFDAQIKVLKEQVEHHVEEEESDLFPKVKKILDSNELKALGVQMRAEQVSLEEKGDARSTVPDETKETATLVR